MIYTILPRWIANTFNNSIRTITQSILFCWNKNHSHIYDTACCCFFNVATFFSRKHVLHSASFMGLLCKKNHIAEVQVLYFFIIKIIWSAKFVLLQVIKKMWYLDVARTNEGSFKLNSCKRSKICSQNKQKTFIFFVRSEFSVILLNKLSSTRSIGMLSWMPLLYVLLTYPKMGIFCMCLRARVGRLFEANKSCQTQ